MKISSLADEAAGQGYELGITSQEADSDMVQWQSWQWILRNYVVVVGYGYVQSIV